MADPNNINADQEYRTAVAERGKFWPVDTDYLTSIGYPLTGEGKYATLTYQINSAPISLSGDIMIELDSESVIGTSSSNTVQQQGGVAETTTPTPVGDGDTVAVWYDEYGRQIIAGYNTTLSAIDVNVLSGMQVNIAEATIPSPVADGDEVNVWYDTYGRQVIAGYNQSLNAVDINEVNPALLQRLGPVTNLDDVVANTTGTTVEVSNYHNFTIHVIVSGSTTTGATVSIEHSLNGSDWVEIDREDVIADGITELAISQQAYRYLRTVVSDYIDGTYTTLIYAGN